MAKYKVLKKFRDTHTKGIYKKDAEIEMTVERADEVEKNLDGSFLVQIDNDENKTNAEEVEIEAIKAELESLDVSFHPNTGLKKLREKLEEIKGVSTEKE